MYLLTYLFICTRWYISQTIWHWLPIFQVDLHCALHRVATSSCHGHIDELVTEPFLLLHREHGTGYRRSWNCCDWRTCSVVIWKHFCFILSTGHRIRIDSVMRPQSSSRGAIQVPQLQLQLHREGKADLCALPSDSCRLTLPATTAAFIQP